MAQRASLFCLAAGILLGGLCPRPMAQAPDPKWEELKRQNLQLQEQLRRHQEAIEQLTGKIADLQRSQEKREREFNDLRKEVGAPAPEPEKSARPYGKVIVSGEVGVALFRGGRESQSPKSEFRVDEAKLFLDAALWKNAYAFAELDLVTREANDEFFHLGELYVDFENVSELVGRDRLLSIRAGRFDIPFGEEYRSRDVIDNPLISHSLSDIWGIDEGVELYGAAGKFEYALAVQNGGHPTLSDFNSDKAVIGRVGVKPADWLYLSASAMRTGDLDVQKDKMSEVWFGNGFFRALGAATNTTHFQADLYELDAQTRWTGGHFKAAGGYARFSDNDRTRDNRRDLRYYYLEALQHLTGRLYTAARFSQIFAGAGYPLVGGGDFGRYFFGPQLTRDLWRLSLGAGYQFSDRLVLKVEYTVNGGRVSSGAQRENEDLFGLELGVKF